MTAKKKGQILIMGPRYAVEHKDQPATNETVEPLLPPGVIEKPSKPNSDPDILYNPDVEEGKENK